MNPQDQHQIPSAPPSNTPSDPNNPYGFIFNPQQKVKASKSKDLLSGVYLPRKMRIIIIAIGIAFILAIAYAIFASGKGGSTKGYSDLIARQQELIRVSELAETQSKDTSVKNLAYTTDNVLTSDQVQLQTYLKRNTKKKDPTINLYLNKNTDTLLTAAAQNNQYDPTYLSYLKTNLTTYQNELKTTEVSAGKKGKAILVSSVNSAQLILNSPLLVDPATAQ